MSEAAAPAAAAAAPNATTEPAATGSAPGTAGSDKKRPSSKGHKEKKKSKAQLKKEAELERIAKEAVEAEGKELAIKAEQDRIQAELDARLKEEDRVRKVAEAARLKIQLDEDTAWISQRQEALDVLDRKAKATSEWDYYVQCSDLPDVSRESELNTYKSLWLEPPDVSVDPVGSITSIVDNMTRTEALIKALMRVTGHAHELWDVKKLVWAADYITTLRDMSNSNIDLVTRQLLQRCDEFDDMDITEGKGNAVDAQFQRAYGTSEVLYGLWVHTSPKGRQKQLVFKEIGVTIDLPISLVKARNAIRLVYTSYDHFCGPRDKRGKPGDEPAKKTLKQWDDEEEKEEELDLAIPGMDPDVPFVSLGGVINCQQLAVPPPPKPVKGWQMREMTELAYQVQEIPYPLDNSDDEVLPLKIVYTVPDYVILGDDKLFFGWWNADKGTWSIDSIQPQGFDRKTFKMEVLVSTTKPFAIVQPRTLDFPYRSWAIKPLSSDSCMVILRGSRFTVELELKAGKMALRSPRFPVLANHGLQDTFMPPGMLLMRLARSGLNLLPTDEDMKFARKPARERGLEPYLHEQISMISHCFEIKGSPFNASRPSNQSLFSVRYNPTIDEMLAEDALELEGNRPPSAPAPPPPEPEHDGGDENGGEEEDAESEATDENAEDEPPPPDLDSEQGQMSGMESDLLMGFIGKAKRKKPTVNSWVHIVAGQDHFSVVQLDQRGVVKQDPVKATKNSHCSLRRLMVAHYLKFKRKGKMPYPLASMFEVL